MRELNVIGIGMGPQHVTPEAAEALRACDFVVAVDKRLDELRGQGDPLLEVRREICRDAGVELVTVPDPERDRADPADYPGAVRDWHERRVAAYASVLGERPGTPGMLVWGDSSLYDSSIRIAEALVARDVLTGYRVIPGISALQLLAARHRLVLNDVGGAVHVTTGRRLPEAVAAGMPSIVVMLNRDLAIEELANWSIWWGGNIGAAGEELVSGRVGDVLPEIRSARERARAADGWVMDIYLLRRPG